MEKKTNSLTDYDRRLISTIREAATDTFGRLDLLLKYRDEITKDSTYAIKTRVKSVVSFESKLQRKREQKDSNYQADDVSDVIGVRLITLFRDEMVGIASTVFQSIASGEVPFIKGAIEELIVYKSDRASDEVEDAVLAAASKIFGDDKVADIRDSDTKDSGYSSIHIVARLDAGLRDADSFSPHLKDYKVPVEFQIRTVFDDAWGEIDHKYKFKVVEEGGDGRRSKNYFVNGHIANLKALTDGCAQYANLIHREASSKAEFLEVRKEQKQADSDEAVAKILEANGVNDQVQAYVLAKRKQYADLQSKKLRGERDGISEQFARAADGLRSVRENSTSLGDSPHKGSERAAYYFLSMEEALLRYATDADDEVRRAIEIYKDLVDKLGSNAVLHYRLGHAYDAVGEYELALQSYDRVRQLVADAGTMNPNDPNDYKSWAIDTATNRLPIALSFTLAQIAESSDDSVKKLDLYHQAHIVSMTPLQSGDPASEVRHKLLNNSLYHALEAVKANNGVKPDWVDQALIEDLTHKLDQSCVDHHDIAGVAEWHTLLEAFEYLGDKGKASKAASKVVTMLRTLDEANSLSLTRQEAEILLQASKILADYLSD